MFRVLAIALVAAISPMALNAQAPSDFLLANGQVLMAQGKSDEKGKSGGQGQGQGQGQNKGQSQGKGQDSESGQVRGPGHGQSGREGDKDGRPAFRDDHRRVVNDYYRKEYYSRGSCPPGLRRKTTAACRRDKPRRATQLASPGHAIKKAFDKMASQYDAQRRWIIPEIKDFYSAAVWAAECKHTHPAILDIGAGTGLLSALILQKYPDASMTLVDLSAQMLGIAKERFANRKDIRYITGEFSNVDIGGCYDLICSALSIHHVEQAGPSNGCIKRSLKHYIPGEFL